MKRFYEDDQWVDRYAGRVLVAIGVFMLIFGCWTQATYMTTLAIFYQTTWIFREYL